MSDVIIIHFRSISNYPPILNLMRIFSEQKKMKVVLFTSSLTSAPKFNDNVELVSVRASSWKIFKDILILQFYILAFQRIMRSKKTPILYFESLSSVPVWLYLRLFKNKRMIMAHFHEYFSNYDYRKQSFWERTGRNLEKEIFHKLSWISHTNADRLNLFKNEFPRLPSDKLHVLPNFPPSNWLKNSPPVIHEPLKLVYVGSLSFDTIYTKEIVDWIVGKQGRVTCDFYSMNASNEMIDFLRNQPDGLVNYKGAVHYAELRDILKTYDVGLILYKGISENVIYSAPNKLFEYLACGLDVWCSEALISSKQYAHSDSYPKVVMIDFKKLDTFDYLDALDRKGLTFRQSPYVMEMVYEKLYQEIAREKQLAR